MRKRFLTEDVADVQVFTGIGGVGKTQLAVAYAYQFASAYDFAWWINAAQPALIGEQFATLGSGLGCIEEAGTVTEAVRAIILAELRDRGRWLLVFDDVQDPAHVREWLPGGNGHVLITSQRGDWVETAVPVEVGVLTRRESVDMLRHRDSALSDADADRLAGALGDLPLAIAQAAEYMAATGGRPAEEYLHLLRTRAGQILDRGQPQTYPRTLAAATHLSFDRLEKDDPAAAALATLCAFLAPEPLPDEFFRTGASALPPELRLRASDRLAWGEVLRQLRSLARIDQGAIQMHRLTQLILRDRLSPHQIAQARSSVEALLVASNPGDPGNPADWPTWVPLMPHLLAADLAGTASPELRELACNGCAYLLARGDTADARDLAGELRDRWRQRLGTDDPDTLLITHYLARSLRELGDLQTARELDEDTLDRRRRLLGDDNRATLSSASSLAIVLSRQGDLLAARDVDEDTLRRRRRVLGPDDPDALASASNLAADLSDLGELEEARDLYADTLKRCHRVLGENHPDTVKNAMNLAITLTKLGDVQAARPLAEDAVRRLRLMQGENHPDTLMTISNLAEILREIDRELPAAREHARYAMDGLRRVLGADHSYSLSAAGNLAEVLRRSGELADARTLAEDTLARQRTVHGEDDPRTAETERTLADILSDLARRSRAS